jgi:hypothetical protein
MDSYGFRERMLDGLRCLAEGRYLPAAITSKMARIGNPHGGSVGMGAIWPEIVIEKFWVASGLTPLVASIVPVYTPPVVGVPDSTPVAVRVRPGGKTPDEKVGVGTPVAVYEKL